MRPLKEDRVALTAQLNQMNQQDKQDRAGRDEYFGWNNFEPSRRERAHGGSHEDGDYWEE